MTPPKSTQKGLRGAQITITTPTKYCRKTTHHLGSQRRQFGRINRLGILYGKMILSFLFSHDLYISLLLLSMQFKWLVHFDRLMAIQRMLVSVCCCFCLLALERRGGVERCGHDHSNNLRFVSGGNGGLSFVPLLDESLTIFFSIIITWLDSSTVKPNGWVHLGKIPLTI